MARVRGNSSRIESVVFSIFPSGNQELANLRSDRNAGKRTRETNHAQAGLGLGRLFWVFVMLWMPYDTDHRSTAIGVYPKVDGNVAW